MQSRLVIVRNTFSPYMLRAAVGGIPAEKFENSVNL